MIPIGWAIGSGLDQVGARLEDVEWVILGIVLVAAAVQGIIGAVSASALVLTGSVLLASNRCSSSEDWCGYRRSASYDNPDERTLSALRRQKGRVVPRAATCDL
jgi:hypothetical protein